MYVCASHVSLIPTEAKRGHRILCYRWLSAVMWMLRMEPMSPGRASSALSCRATSSDVFPLDGFICIKIISIQIFWYMPGIAIKSLSIYNSGEKKCVPRLVL